MLGLDEEESRSSVLVIGKILQDKYDLMLGYVGPVMSLTDFISLPSSHRVVPR